MSLLALQWGWVVFLPLPLPSSLGAWGLLEVVLLVAGVVGCRGNFAIRHYVCLQTTGLGACCARRRCSGYFGGRVFEILGVRVLRARCADAPCERVARGATGVYGDMIAMGILDPAKVTRTALQSAGSVAGMMITTEAMITEQPEPAAAAAPMPDMGGMGGMGGMM